MIISEYVTVKWVGSTRKYYESLGYTFTRIGDEFQVKASDLKEKSGQKIRVACDLCGAEKEMTRQTYTNVMNANNGLYRCSDCMYRDRGDKKILKNAKKNIDIFNSYCKANNYIPITTEKDYKGITKKVEFICPKHGKQSLSLERIIYTDAHCPMCKNDYISQHMSLTWQDVKSRIESYNGNILLNPEDYDGYYTKNLKIICGKCKKIFITNMLCFTASSTHLCPECGSNSSYGKNRLSKDTVIKRCSNCGVEILNPDEYKGYAINNLKIKCVFCGEIVIRSLRAIEDGFIYCNKCKPTTSSGERILIEIFNKYDIKYVYQKRFDDCKDKKTLPFDFYLPKYNTIVEFDGQQHYLPTYGEDHLFITQKHDKIKNEYCERNNIKLIRIPYWEGNNMETIIKNELNIA